MKRNIDLRGSKVKNNFIIGVGNLHKRHLHRQGEEDYTLTLCDDNCNYGAN